MTSIKVKFRASIVADHPGTIYYQIIHERRVRQLLSSYRIFHSEWDSERSTIKLGDGSDRNKSLLSIRERIRCDLDRLARIERKLSSTWLPYSADDIIDEFHRYEKEYTLFRYMEKRIEALTDEGKIGTACNYRYTLNSFRRFRKDEDIMLDNVTAELMTIYEAWLRKHGVSPNSISFYIRNLRAVYNHAADNNIIENRFPFKRVYTGIGKTVKRALPLAVIKRIKELDLSSKPGLKFARDMFMMSFYLRGMSFIDMCFLRKSDLRNGYITYRRRKTNQLLTIAWKKEMQEIVDNYPRSESEYLLPIIRKAGLNERSVYRNASYRINCKLKQIAALIDIDFPLTLYVARHSWASGARSIGIPVGVISEGMGHDSESTTRIYLSNLDTAIVDNANSLIIASL